MWFWQALAKHMVLVGGVVFSESPGAHLTEGHCLQFTAQ